MKKILARCPRCKSTFKVIAEKVAGKKLRCASCQQAFRVPTSAAPVSAKSSGGKSKPSDEVEDYEGVVEVVDDGDDEWGGDFSLDDFDEIEGPVSSRRPSRALPAQVGRKKSEPARQKDDGDEKPAGMSGQTKMLVAGIAAGGLFLVGGLVLGVVLLLPKLSGSKIEAPTQFEEFREKNFPFAIENVPSGWEKEFGGGDSGRAAWARFTKGRAKISIRESLKGSLVGGQPNMQDKGAEELEPVAGVHMFQRRFIEEDYGSFDEGPPQKLITKFGNIRRSVFTATGKGPFGAKLKGYRATLLSNITSYNVICECSETDFDVYKAAFEKAIDSITAQ